MHQAASSLTGPILTNNNSQSVHRFVAALSDCSSINEFKTTSDCSEYIDEDDNSDTCENLIGEQQGVIKMESTVSDAAQKAEPRQAAANCCAKCRKPLREKFILSVIDLHWHQDCVQCDDCSLKLTDRCYTSDGKLYCKIDYWRRFGPKCANCLQSIEPSELVQRIKGNRVYHLKCFACHDCGRQLEFGEQLHLIDGKRMLCKQDYQKQVSMALVANGKPTLSDRDSGFAPADYSSSPNSQSSQQHLTTLMSPIGGQQQQQAGKLVSDEVTFAHNYAPGQPLKQQQQQAKASQQLKHDSSSSVESASSTSIKQEKQQQQPNGENSDDLIDANGKRRGPRTTIKPKQLETLRRAFETAPKPSRNTREQLATETGLNMRVIQVWFQNRRSKERRMRNSNGSARRNFFRTSSRRLRVGPPGSGAQADGGAQQQQSLMATQAPGALANGRAAAPAKSKGQKQAAQIAQLDTAGVKNTDQLLTADPNDGSESPSDFGAGLGNSTPGGSDGEFTYFSDSSNQGDNQAAFAINGHQISKQYNGAQRHPNGSPATTGPANQAQQYPAQTVVGQSPPHIYQTQQQTQQTAMQMIGTPPPQHHQMQAPLAAPPAQAQHFHAHSQQQQQQQQQQQSQFSLHGHLHQRHHQQQPPVSQLATAPPPPPPQQQQQQPPHLHHHLSHHHHNRHHHSGSSPPPPTSVVQW